MARKPISRTGRIILWAIGIGLALFYLAPIGYALFAPAHELPAETTPKTVVPASLSEDNAVSAVVIMARDFSPDQISNEPFPKTIQGGLGSCPPPPPPMIRIRTSEDRDWFTPAFWIFFFPIGILAGGGAVMFGGAALVGLATNFKPLWNWGRVLGVLAWAAIACAAAGFTFLLVIWPQALAAYYAGHRPAIWNTPPLSLYLRGPTSKPYPDLVVANGTASSVELYANGLWIDTLPAKALRKYRPLTGLSRLSALNSKTRAVLDDVGIRDATAPDGFLIYNVQGADQFIVATPPRYECF